MDIYTFHILNIFFIYNAHTLEKTVLQCKGGLKLRLTDETFYPYLLFATSLLNTKNVQNNRKSNFDSNMSNFFCFL